MRSLNSSDNTNAVSADYPYRQVRDTVGATDGTKLWERIFADMIHGIQKVIRLVGLTPNDLPDNETNGYQILEAFERLGQPKVYTANWTDAGGGDIYADSTDIDFLTEGKTYKFIVDKNLLPSDGVYLKVDAVDFSINFVNCSFILSNQPFNVYVDSATSVQVSPISNVNEFIGSSFNSFELFSNINLIGGIFKYKNRYYVSRLASDRINVYDSEGVLKVEFGASGSGAGELDSPRGITAVNDKLYICDYNNNRVNVYSLTGSFIFSFNGGNMLQPNKIVASETQNKIYIIDSNTQDNAKAYSADDGLYNFTFGLNENFTDIAIHKDIVYLLFYSSGIDSSIRLFDASNSAAIVGQGLFNFEASLNVNKLFAVNDNYMILKGSDGIFLVDKNYKIYDVNDKYRDNLKTIISDYTFEDGNIDGKELYFANNDFYDDKRSIYKFL